MLCNVGSRSGEYVPQKVNVIVNSDRSRSECGNLNVFRRLLRRSTPRNDAIGKISIASPASPLSPPLRGEELDNISVIIRA